MGCGRWGRLILRDLLRHGCEVLVADPSEEARRQAIHDGAAGAVSGLESLPDIAGALVATPTTAHAGVIAPLLKRGIPVFSEKPLTADPASAACLSALAPTKLFVMDKWRYHPGIELLGQIARSGELGPVVGLRTRRIGWDHSHSDVDAIWILAPHDLSIALEVLGYVPEPRGAVAERWGHVATGLVGLLGTAPWMVLEVSGLGLARAREVRLHCEGGVALVGDPYSPYVEIARSPAWHEGGVPLIERRAISPEFPLVRELRAFLEYLHGGPPPRSSAAEGVAIVTALGRLRELAGLELSAGKG